MIDRIERNMFEDVMTKSCSITYPDLEDVIDWMKLNLRPEQIFNESDLENWAENNGYIKEET